MCCLMTTWQPTLAPLGSATSTNAKAYLLWLQALHQQYHGYCMSYDYLPGPVNNMTNDCSQIWYLTDSKLLSHFPFIIHRWVAGNSAFTQCLEFSTDLCTAVTAAHAGIVPSCTLATNHHWTIASNWIPSSQMPMWTPSCSSMSLPFATMMATLNPAAN